MVPGPTEQGQHEQEAECRRESAGADRPEVSTTSASAYATHDFIL